MPDSAPPPSARDVAGQKAVAEHPERHIGEKPAVVDGSNIAHFGETGASIENIALVCDKLIEQGWDPIVIADAALRHQVDNGAAYERMVRDGTIVQAPAGTDADYFILAYARRLHAHIVSNDRFRDRERAFPEARERIIRYMIVDGEVVLEQRAKQRND